MKKDFGQVFTPNWIVELMLNLINYNDKHIINKYIMEPSCGDGAFLIEIVKRYINISLENDIHIDDIKKGLETYIHGIELDDTIYYLCVEKLNKLASDYNIHDVKWNIKNIDALTMLDTELKMDYVIGNPPYVRIHNMKKELKEYLRNHYSLCEKGMIDLYIAFYELGINLLKSDGVLAYITPNTFMNNTSSKKFRKMIEQNNYLSKLINFGTNQIFDASTYTAITVLNKNNTNSKFKYYTYENGNTISDNESCIKFIEEIDLNNYSNRTWNFTDSHNFKFVNNLITSENKLHNQVNVQYGFATLRDKIYISSNIQSIDNNFSLFNGFKIENELLYPIVKGSKYNGETIKSKIIYPYKLVNDRWEPILEDELKTLYPYTYEYFSFHKEELLKRNMDNNIQSWFQFGRSQGIQNIHHEKLVVDMFVKAGNNIKPYLLPSNVFVYSGVFITGSNLPKVKQILESDDFYKYIQIVGKDMRNGYKSLSTSHIKNFSSTIINS